MAAILAFLVIPVRQLTDTLQRESRRRPTRQAQHGNENSGADPRACSTWLFRKGRTRGSGPPNFNKRDRFNGEDSE